MVLSAERQHLEGSIISFVMQMDVGAAAAADLAHRGHLDLAAADGSARLSLLGADFRMPLPIEGHCLAVARSSPL